MNISPLETAVDGVVDGYPGDFTREWVTRGEGAGAWIELNWLMPQTVNRIVLYDRPNMSDQVLGATLTFSDRSSVVVGALDNAGAAMEVLFAPRSITSLRLTIDQISRSTGEIGLAEIEVYTSM
jgi:hypothetical protein